MQKKKIYIAGKVTGLDYAKVEQKFNAMEENLVKAGFDVLNPLKIVNDPNCDWQKAMDMCLERLPEADGVVLLYDAHISKGALEEIKDAQRLKIPIYNGIMDFINQTPWIR